MRIGIGIGIPDMPGGGTGTPAYDPDAVTLFAAMSVQPDSTRKQLISDTIAALKAAGIWALLDECWVMAAHDSQAGLLGWKRYKDLTAVNAPTFEADRGYAGNGTTSYLNTGFVPSTAGINYTLNNASLGVYSRTDILGVLTDIGAREVANINASTLLIRVTNDIFHGRVNTNSISDSVACNTSLGLFVARRANSGSGNLWRNGSSLGNYSSAASARISIALYIAARNTHTGPPDSFSTRQYAFAFVGAGMSPQQQADLHTIVQQYMTAIGAAV